jgi:hypothetical protein
VCVKFFSLFLASNEDRRVILGVDFLQDSSGLIQKFLALENLFRIMPKLRNDVTVVQVSRVPVVKPFLIQKFQIAVLPDTTSYTKYLQQRIAGIVARMNAEFGKVKQNIRGQYSQPSFPLSRFITCTMSPLNNTLPLIYRLGLQGQYFSTTCPPLALSWQLSWWYAM